MENDGENDSDEQRYLVTVLSIQPSPLPVTKVGSIVDLICHGSCDRTTKVRAHDLCEMSPHLNYIPRDVPPDINIHGERLLLSKKVPAWYMLPLVGACLSVNFTPEKIKSTVTSVLELAKGVKESHALLGHPKSD